MSADISTLICFVLLSRIQSFFTFANIRFYEVFLPFRVSFLKLHTTFRNYKHGKRSSINFIPIYQTPFQCSTHTWQTGKPAFDSNFPNHLLLTTHINRKPHTVGIGEFRIFGVCYLLQFRFLVCLMLFALLSLNIYDKDRRRLICKHNIESL